jgi:hypothetical protein
MQGYSKTPSRNASMKAGATTKVSVPGCGMERPAPASNPGSKAAPIAGFSKKSGQIPGKV